MRDKAGTDTLFLLYLSEFYSWSTNLHSEEVQGKCFRLKFYSPLLSKNSVETARFRTSSLVRIRKHFKMFLEVREA